MADKSAFELAKGFAPDTIRSRDNYRRRGHGFQTGDVVYFDGADWKKSDWLYFNATGSSEALGVVEVKDNYRFDVVYRGSILLPTSIQVTGPAESIQENTVYFLSDTPGVLTETPPLIDVDDPKVRKPILATLNSDGAGNINGLVVNYRGYVEDTNGCVAFVQNIMPVGTIEFIPSGEKTPQEWKQEGWLLCDGSEYFIDEYPELFGVVGWAYGSPTANDRFRVPNLWHLQPNQTPALRLGTQQPCCWAYRVVSYASCKDGVMCEPCCVGDQCNASNFSCCSCTNIRVEAFELPMIDTDGDGIPDTCDTSIIDPNEIPDIGSLPGLCGPPPLNWCYNTGFCSLDEIKAAWPCLDWGTRSGTVKLCCGDAQCGLPSLCSIQYDNGYCDIPGNCGSYACNPGLYDTFVDLWGRGGPCGGNGCSSTDPGNQNDPILLAETLCNACSCQSGTWGGCSGGGGGESPQPTASPAVSSSPQATSSPAATPSVSSSGGPRVSVSPSSGPTPTATPTRTPTPTPTPSIDSTTTPTPSPSPSIPGPPPPGVGRILIGRNIGASEPSNAYGGDDDIEIVPDTAGLLGQGTGYAASSTNKNKQAAYHGNFYIRAISVQKYVNIETCNGAGGAVRNWLPNGSFNVWQRGTSFDPDITKIESDHLADLNRYTADRWFRKVGYCPEGFGATGSGASSHSDYVGVCNRKSFNTIETTIPESLRKQYPSHFMEYQSYISGPGVDTSLEYCLLENRISDVRTLAGETVCVSFWARADKAGSVYVNLKQHFGYDVPPSTPLTVRAAPLISEVAAANKNETGYYSFVDDLHYGDDYGVSGPYAIGKGRPAQNLFAYYLATGNPNEHDTGETLTLAADSSAQGGVNAVFDGVVLLPNAEEVQSILLQDVSVFDSPDIGLVEVTPPPKKYGIVPTLTVEEPLTEVFYKNINNTANIKVEGKSAAAVDIAINASDSVNSETLHSVSISINVSCIPDPTCVSCSPYVTHIDALGIEIYTNEEVNPCVATLNGDGIVSVPSGSVGTVHSASIAVSETDYALIQSFTRGEIGFPPTVTAQALAAANQLLSESPNACRCQEQSTNTFRLLGAPGSCFNGITTPKNYDATETIGICCIVTAGSVEVGQSGASYVTHTREENHTVHSCAALGGQFIPNYAVEYFNQFESTTCGVTEDQCSEYAKIDVTTTWQQYEIVFRIPPVDNRYIGNSGTDYLSLQLWTHLSNGYCRAYSGAEAPPRNRLGENYGTVECSENSLCESCVSIFPTAFSYNGKLNLAQFQVQTGTEFTGFVTPNRIEELENCQSFFEANTCAGRREYYPVSGNDFFEYQVFLKKEKLCKTPRTVLTSFNSAPFGVNGIDILTSTQKDFVVGGDVWVDNGAVSLVFGYECDCDIYRPEELQYLSRQLEWKVAES